MGLLDDAIRQFTQNGQVPPQMVEIFQELILGPNQQRGDDRTAPQPQQQAQAPQAATPAEQPGSPDLGGLGGLGGLLEQLQKGGLDDVVKSWVGSGENKAVHPDDLGNALGKQTVTQMADKAGCEQQDILSQLAKALPGLIDQLTRDGRVPTQTEISQRLKGN